MPTNISGKRPALGRSVAGVVLLALVATGCGNAGSVEPLGLDLESDSARTTLANALRLEEGGGAAIELLREPLADTNWVVRAQAAAILGSLGEPATELVGPVASDPHESVRIAAIEALHRISGSATVPWLMRALDDSVPRVRVRSLRALANVGALTANDAPQIVALLGDNNGKARRWASMVTISMGGRAVAALESALSGEAESRWRAAWALGQIGPPAAAALPRLRELVDDAHHRVGTESRTAILAIELDQ